MQTTPGRELILDALPPDMRPMVGELSLPNIRKLFQTLAVKYPDKYKDIAQKLMKVGEDAMYSSGGYSFGLRHMLPAKSFQVARSQLQKKIIQIVANPRLTEDQKSKQIIELSDTVTPGIEKDIFNEALSNKNPLALQIASGSKGKPGNLRSLIGSDLLYVDHLDRKIPMPVLRSYSEGLSPAEYWAGAYGARKGVVDLKFATQNAGFFCLAKGTAVRMGDFSSKNIEDIKSGDMVLGANKAGSTFPVRVTATFDNGIKPLFNFHFCGNLHGEVETISITATAEHKVLVRCGSTNIKLPLSQCNASHSLVIAPPTLAELNCLFCLTGSEAIGDGTTYDIEVDHPDHLFVLANGAIVSNSKQLIQAAHRLLITAKDHDPKEYNPDAPRGLPVSVDDPDSEGAMLAHTFGPYKRNTVITPHILSHLKELGHDRILVRSPLVGGPKDGGLYSMDAGVRERGVPSPIGDFVGIAAAQSIGEVTSQATIGCLAKDTEVRMVDWSIKKIQDIQIGDIVLGADSNGNTFPSNVTHTFDSGLKTCYRYSFTQGNGGSDVRYVECTPEHKILSTIQRYGKKNRALNNVPSKYMIGSTLGVLGAVSFNKFTDDSKCVNNKYALFIGLVLGDGSYTNGNNVYLACCDNSLIVDLQPILAKLPLKLMCTYKDKNYRFAKKVWNTREPHQLRKEMNQLGMGHKYSYEKTIPQACYNWTNNSVAELMAGLYITDGCVFVSDKSAIKISYVSSSRKMVEQIKELLEWRFGIRSAKVIEYLEKRVNHRPWYQVVIKRPEDIIKFANLIPLVGIKAKTIQKAVQIVRTKNSRSLINRIRRKKMECIGKQPTYDIEVDNPDHLFVLANGLIVSNSKHTGGVAGAGHGVSGFKALNLLTQIPKIYPGGQVYSQADGKVSRIEPAPGGGHRIFINDQMHYIPVEATPTVKQGDEVEAGFPLSDGLPNPAEVTYHRGVGAGRKAFTDAFKQSTKDAGFNISRRNIEMVARGLINHVKLHNSLGEFLPDDVIAYSTLEHIYKPRAGHQVLKPSDAKGKYLEQPVLHYTIGTQIKPSVIKDLNAFNVKNVVTHHESPDFEPLPLRGMENMLHDPDWMTRMLGSNLEKGLLQGVRRGATSDERGTSYVPSLAKGVDFGKYPPIKGFDINEVKSQPKVVLP